MFYDDVWILWPISFFDFCDIQPFLHLVTLENDNTSLPFLRFTIRQKPSVTLLKNVSICVRMVFQVVSTRMDEWVNQLLNIDTFFGRVLIKTFETIISAFWLRWFYKKSSIFLFVYHHIGTFPYNETLKKFFPENPVFFIPSLNLRITFFFVKLFRRMTY